MSQGNVEIVRGVYAEWGQGNMQTGVELFDPNIEFESFMPDASERVVAKGPAEVEAFMRAFLRQWRDYKLFGDEFRDEGTQVLVIGHQTATGRQSGIALEDTVCSVWTFRDGRVTHLLFDRDRRRTLEAAGLSE